MKQEIIEKIMELIQNGELSTIRTQDDGWIYFHHNNKEKNYSVTRTKFLEGTDEHGSRNKEVSKKDDLEEKDIISILKLPELEEGVIEVYQERIKKEAEYDEARKKLLEELNSIEMDEKTRRVMKAIIEKVSQVKPSNNRIYLSRTPLGSDVNCREELLLDDRQTGNLHLQLVTRIEEESGMTYHWYPQLTLEEITRKYVEGKDIEDIVLQLTDKDEKKVASDKQQDIEER